MPIKRTHADPPSPGPENRRGPTSAFTYKAVVTALAGGALTLVIAIAQISYSNHLEFLRRQGEQGAEVQRRLLELTGQIENELWNVIQTATQPGGGPEQAKQRHDEAVNRLNQNLAPLYQRWLTERLLLRNLGSQVYGREVGRLIYDRTDSLFHADGCDVVRRGVDPREPDCRESMQQELNQLAPFVAGLTRSETLDAFQTNEGSPTSFDANVGIANTIVHHFFECTATDNTSMAQKPRCLHLPEMVGIARRRISLVHVARENLANAIMAASALRQ